MLLGPDDLSARLQPAGHQTRSDDVAVQSTVPNISDIAGKQRIRLPPVDAVVVEHLAQSELAATELTAPSPGRLVAYPIRRVGDHQVRLRSGQHLPDIRRTGAVAAANPMLAEQPHVTSPSDRSIGCLWDAVGIGQTARSRTGQDGCEMIRVETDQIDIETGELERPELAAEQFKIPARPRCQLIVRHAIGLLFLLAPAARNDHRNFRKPKFGRRTNTQMTGQQ